jgi:glycosyltransferase involved in cell wall biosynthesis
MTKKIFILGPAYPYRGGLASFDERLAQAFQAEGHHVTIFTFTLQYPAILFPGKSQFSEDPPPAYINIVRAINAINPFNWWRVGRQLRKLQPDIVVVRYWLPFMGPSLGSICRQIKKNKRSTIVAITDNIIPHEKRRGDTLFTRFFLKHCDAFITMSAQVMAQLKKFQPHKPALQVVHPLYDNFGEAVAITTARKKLGIDEDAAVLLFFGFIRKYKGLDILLEAIHLLAIRKWIPPSSKKFILLIAGEFYEPQEPYLSLIKQWKIEEWLMLATHFIPNSEVKYYFSAANGVIQPYRNATQSGVTPLAYHFEKPMIVTQVGALPDYVPHQKAGLVTNPTAASLAEAIIAYFEKGEDYFLAGLKEEKIKYSWPLLTQNILSFCPILS